MKSILILVFACASLFLGGCANNSLMTDEEYENSRGPAPYAPDPTRHIPMSNPYARGRY